MGNLLFHMNYMGQDQHQTFIGANPAWSFTSKAIPWHGGQPIITTYLAYSAIGKSILSAEI